MEFKTGDRVLLEAESTERKPRRGEVLEVLGAAGRKRYRIRWDDGHESIYTPEGGALRREQPVRTA